MILHGTLLFFQLFRSESRFETPIVFFALVSRNYSKLPVDCNSFVGKFLFFCPFQTLKVLAA